MGQSMSKPQDRWVLGCTPSWLHLSGAVRDAEFDCCSPAGAMGLKRRPSRCVPRHWKHVLNFKVTAGNPTHGMWMGKLLVHPYSSLAP
jgi:hypothetical protein